MAAGTHTYRTVDIFTAIVCLSGGACTSFSVEVPTLDLEFNTTNITFCKNQESDELTVPATRLARRHTTSSLNGMTGVLTHQALVREVASPALTLSLVHMLSVIPLQSSEDGQIGPVRHTFISPLTLFSVDVCVTTPTGQTQCGEFIATTRSNCPTSCVVMPQSLLNNDCTSCLSQLQGQ